MISVTQECGWQGRKRQEGHDRQEKGYMMGGGKFDSDAGV